MTSITLPVTIGENCLEVEYDVSGEYVEDAHFDQLDIDALAIIIDGCYVPLRQALQDAAAREYAERRVVFGSEYDSERQPK